MSKKTKETIRKATVCNFGFWIFGIISLTLGIIGFFMPPKGAIDGSVLTFAGIMFAFAGLHNVVNAIEKGIDARVKLGQTEVTIGKNNN